MKIQFLGATRTVTGSRYLVEENGFRMLVDCGLFQGPRLWKQRNWEDFPVDPASIDCVLLTHAHIDHSGYLPRLAKLGFQGTVYCTPPTVELLGLMLPDSGHIQEEDARFANKKRYTKHDPALPLYTEEDAENVLSQLEGIEFYEEKRLNNNLSFTFVRAGHILGSAMIRVKNRNHTFLFSGDIGRPAQFITRKPDGIEDADFLVVESTYGNRLHQRIDVRKRLTDIIRKTASHGGMILVPAFAIGRTQELLFLLRGLEEKHEIPQLPVFFDSPMAIKAIPIYDRHDEDSSKALEQLREKDPTPFICHHIKALRSVQESMTLNDITYPCIIVSSSGMATGGRILHHLKRRISDHRNTVLFIGFQAEGTKGRLLVDGIRELRIHGKEYPVRANIEYFDALSCHADYEEMLDWLKSANQTPGNVFVVHGEESASLSMADKIRDQFGWKVTVPEYLQSFEL